MNSKKIILLGCVAACVLAASTATAQMRGHGSSMPRMGMRGGSMPHSMGRMPIHRGPMMNSPSGLRRFGNRDFNRNDRFRRFNRFNDGRFVRNHRFHRFNHFNHFNHFNDVVFIGNFGFPWWWGWGSGYPYGYYGGYNYGGYGPGYGYGDNSRSRVAELQSRLARAGYYHGSIDGIMGPATRRAIRAYERHRGYVG
jgi:putative peptidoglycan binding protein